MTGYSDWFQGQDFYKTVMMQQGQVFYTLGEQLSKLYQVMAKADDTNWQDKLNRWVNSMHPMFEQYGWATFPFAMSETQLAYLKAAMLASIEKLLSVPGIGPARALQGQLQEGMQLVDQYQQVANEYVGEINKISLAALESMRLRILEMAEKKEEINSLRGLYDLWVDCNEAAYKAHVDTDEYAELYGRLTNSLLAVKQYHHKIQDRVFRQFNMPTRDGMNTLLQQVWQTKRQLRETELKQVSSATRIKSMENEIGALYKLIEKLEKSQAQVTKVTKAVRKQTKVSKISKKAAVKKTKKKITKRSS